MIPRRFYPSVILFILAILLASIGLWLTCQYQIVKGPYPFKFTLTTEKPADYFDVGKLQEGQFVHVHLDFWPSYNQSSGLIYLPGIISYGDYERLNAMGQLYNYYSVAWVAFYGGPPDFYDTELPCLGRDNYYVYIFGPLGLHSAEISVVVYTQSDLGSTLIDYAIGGALFSFISVFLEAIFPVRNQKLRSF